MAGQRREQAQGESAETLGTLAMMAAVATVGREDPASVVAEALGALDVLIDRGDLATPEDQRIAQATVLARVWQGFGVDGVGPDRYLARDWWLERFRETGWVHLWVRAPRPASAFGGVRLYRGATAARRDGLSWTDSRTLAAWFAAGHGGCVWSALVPPDRLLVALPIWVRASGLDASTEFVVDTSGLSIIEAVR